MLANTRVEVDSDHWYTPADILRRVAWAYDGDVFTDPCTCPNAYNTLPQELHNVITPIYDLDFLHAEYDGLPRIFLNPPYSKAVGTAGAFTDRALEMVEYARENGALYRAIVLVNASIDTAWWQRLAASSAAICFVESRIPFEQVAEVNLPLFEENHLVRIPGTQPRYASTIHYLDSGDYFRSGRPERVARFCSEFDDLGFISA